MRQLTNSLADIARRAVLVSLGAGDTAGLGLDEAAAAGLAEVVASAGREFAAAAFEAAMLASSEMKQTHDPRLLLELLLLRLSARPGTGAPPALAAVGTAPVAAAAVAPPTVTASPVAPAAPAVQLPAGAGLDAIIERWPALLEALRGTSPATRVKALLVSSSAAPAELDDDLLTIGFRWAVHSEKAQEPTNRQALEAAISQVYGRTYRLQFKVVVMTAPADATPASPASPTAGAAPTPTASAEDGSGQGLVQAAQEILGARVVDVRNRETAGG